MVKIKYKNLSDEMLLVESQNLLNELKAFMNHIIISTKKMTELSNKVNEINSELKVRGSKEPQSKLSLCMLSTKVELEEMLIMLNNHNKEWNNQNQPQ